MVGVPGDRKARGRTASADRSGRPVVGGSQSEKIQRPVHFRRSGKLDSLLRMNRKRTSIARPLTEAEAEELCRLGGIPTRWRARFAQAVERCVTTYERVLNQKSASEVAGELRQIEKQVQSCLNLLNHKTPRPGEVRKRLKTISVALTRLSRRASDFLQHRNVRVAHVKPTTWPAPIGCEIVVDPVCFHDRDDQIDALFQLRAALAGQVAKTRPQSRPRKDTERALYHCLAVAYARDTGRKGSDKAPRFMDVCDKINRTYKLKGWNPSSLPRSARKLLQQDKQK